MSQGEYWKSEQGIADRTDVDNNLIGMNKEEQAQLYEEYVGIGDTPKAAKYPQHRDLCQWEKHMHKE